MKLKKLFLVFFTLLLLDQFIQILILDIGNIYGSQYFKTFILILVLISTIFISLKYWKLVKHLTVVKYVLLYTSFLIIHYVLYYIRVGDVDKWKLIGDFRSYFLWCFAIISFSLIFSKYKDIYLNKNVRYLIIIIFVFTILKILKIHLTYDNISSDTIFAEDDVLSVFFNNFPYYVLWLSVLTIVLMPKLGIINVFIGMVIVLLTAKRGPVVAILMSASILCVINFRRIVFKKKYRRITLLLLILPIIFIFFWEDSLSMFIERWQNDLKSGSSNIGSARQLIWSSLISDWSNNGWFSQIFGNGFESTTYFTKKVFGKNYHAHNDFVEIFYNFGIIGIIFFVLIHISIIRVTFKIYRIDLLKGNLLIFVYSTFLMTNIFTQSIMKESTFFFGICISILNSYYYEKIFEK